MTGDLGVMVAWLLTYAAHSTVLLGAAWLLTRRAVQSNQARDLIWKVALVGGIVSASAQQVIARDPWAGRFEIARAESGVSWTPPTDGRSDGQTVRDVRSPDGEATARPPQPTVQPSDRPTRSSIPWSTVAFWTWAVIAAALVSQYLSRRAGLSWRFGPRDPVDDPTVLELVDQLRVAAGVRRVVRVTQAPNLSSPVALGSSEICLPAVAVSDLEPEQQLSMLAHEVAHLARRDPAWLTASCLIERVFFFQPLNHLARRRLQEAAEYLCDDWAARRTGTGLTLAKCLVRVAEWIDTTPYPVPVSGMAETRSQFVSRIHRLIANHGLRNEPRRRWLLPFALAMIGVVVAAAPGARAGEWRETASTGRETGDQFGDLRLAPAVQGRQTRTATSTTTSTSTSVTMSESPSEASARLPGVPPIDGTWRGEAVPVPQDTGVVAALLAALRDPDIEVRRAAAQSLGNLRSARAVPGLIAALKDEDVEVRAHVLEALGNLRDGRAIDGIREALKDPSPRIRAQAISSLSDMLNESVSRTVGDQIATQLVGMMSDSSLEVRRHAIDILKNYERARPVEAFLAALKDPDKEIRAAAAEALGQAEDGRAVQPLIAALQDKSPDVRHQAAHALGHLHDRRAAEPLAAAMKDVNPDVRMAAVEALGELELTEAPGPLLDALKDENADVRMQAAQALGHIGDGRAVPALVLLLKDQNGDVREHAVDALSQMRDAAAINALVGAMQSSDPNVRRRAAQALGERK